MVLSMEPFNAELVSPTNLQITYFKLTPRSLCNTWRIKQYD